MNFRIGKTLSFFLQILGDLVLFQKAYSQLEVFIEGQSLPVREISSAGGTKKDLSSKYEYIL